MFKLIQTLFSRSSNKELISILPQKPFLVDVRSFEEFTDSKIQNSVNIPLNQIENQIVKFKKHKHIVVFCKSGNRSAQAKRILNKNGFTNVINAGSWQNVCSLIQNQKNNE